MKEKSLLDSYYSEIAEQFKLSEKENKFAKNYVDLVNGGNNTFYQKNITETKIFDEQWIITLESYFPSIDKIIRNPKLTIRYDEDVVAIEKAKKINSNSIRHLASHTQYIKDVSEDEVVTPKKILTTFAEEDLTTYENRFIMTLIDRLFIFVRNRAEIIRDNVLSFQNEHLCYESNFDLNEEKVSFKLDINVKKDLDNKKINKKNLELLQRVEKLVTLISGYKQSQFMRALSKAKKVLPPIMKTNVFLKNADFKNAYTLWLFLDRYNALAYDIEVHERPVGLSKIFKKNLDRLSTFAYSALYQNVKSRKEDYIDLENITPVLKKSTKIAKTNPLDVIKRPDAIEIVDNSVNEYFLEQNKKVLKDEIKELVENKVSEPNAAKKVIKSTIDITNAVFASVFQTEQDEDYFKRYVTEVSPEKVYEESKEKARIAKVIREAKEADYKKSIKLEKSLYLTMLKMNNEQIRKIQNDLKNEALKEYRDQMKQDLEDFKKKKEETKREIDILDGLIADINTGLTTLQQEELEYEQELKKQQEIIIAEVQQSLEEDLEALRKKHIKRMKDLSFKNEAALQRAYDDKQKRLAEYREKLRQERILLETKLITDNKAEVERRLAEFKAIERKLAQKGKDEVKDIKEQERLIAEKHAIKMQKLHEEFYKKNPVGLENEAELEEDENIDPNEPQFEEIKPTEEFEKLELDLPKELENVTNNQTVIVNEVREESVVENVRLVELDENNNEVSTDDNKEILDNNTNEENTAINETENIQVEDTTDSSVEHINEENNTNNETTQSLDENNNVSSPIETITTEENSPSKNTEEESNK